MKHPHRSALLARMASIPAVVTVGIIASVMLALALSGTLSAFTAAITNDKNSVSSGTLVMREQNAAGTVTCLSTDAGGDTGTNSATCTTINKFGGTTLRPGGTGPAVDVTIGNVGTLNASSFTLTPGACTVTKTGAYNGSASDLCTKLRITVKSGASTVFSGTLAAFTGASPAITMPAAPAAGVSVPFTFQVAFDDVTQNSYQGLTATVPITWTFTS